MGFAPALDPGLASDPILRRRKTKSSVRVARGLDDLLMVFAIRSAVYIAEQECPFAEEFDGNDMCATHVVGFIGDEPAGCLRLRFFGDFAKLERLAVRKEFRNSTLAFRLIRFGIDHATRKGYRKLYGHARRGIEPLWERFGARQMPGTSEFKFSDYGYIEMALDVSPPADAITLTSGPMMILRPEGEWDQPGVLDQSASRHARWNEANIVKRGRA